MSNFSFSQNRFPRLGKLSIALLEHMIAPVIGNDTIKEIKSPLSEKELRDSLAQALRNTEDRFVVEHHNKSICESLLNLPLSDIPSVIQAVRVFYSRPTDPQLSKILSAQLSSLCPNLDREIVDSGVSAYISILTEEIANLPGDFRITLSALATLDIRENTKRMAETFSRIERHLIAENISPQGRSRVALNTEALMQSGLFDVPQFVDKVLRLGLISKLNELTKIEPVIAVEGLSGCGKSYLVSSYIETDVAKRNYSSVFWYDPQVDDSLDGFLAQIESILDLKGLSVTSKCKELLSILQRDRALLVIDNFEQVDQGSYSTLIYHAARHGLPASIILISREYFDFIHNLPEIGHLEVRGFDMQEMKRYLANRGLRELTQSSIQNLIDKTDGLPLAASLFATLVIDFGRSVDDLLSGTMLSSTRLHNWFNNVFSKIEEDDAKLLNFLSLCDIPFNKGIINLAGRYEKLRNTDGLFENLQKKYLIQSYTPYRWNAHRLIARFCQSEMNAREKKNRYLAYARYYSRGFINKRAYILSQDELNWLILACRYFQRADRYNESERMLRIISKTIKARGHYEVFIQLSEVELQKNSKRDSWLDYDHAHCCLITGRLKRSLQVIEPLFYSTPEQNPDKRIAISRLYAEILGSMGREQLALEKLLEVLNNFSSLSVHPTILSHAKSIVIWLLTRLANYKDASKLCEELLANSVRRNDKRGGAIVLTRQGIIHQISGRNQLACEELAESVHLFREIEDRRGLGWSLIYLAVSELGLNYDTTGCEHLQEGLQISADIGLCSIDYYELLENIATMAVEKRTQNMVEIELQRVRMSLRDISRNSIR